VMTNIDHEHLENYGGFDDLLQAFVDFANKVPFYGGVVACLDDPHLAAIVPRLTRRVTTYGLDNPGADVTASGVTLEPMGAHAIVTRRARPSTSSGRALSARGEPVEPRAPDDVLGSLALSVPGRHNLQNALAAVAVGLELGLPFDSIAAGLREFRGVERRFEIRGEPNGILVVDDYGHHPTEIAAVIAAARAGIDRRVVVVFQPHRYSRTSQLLQEFGTALSGADEVVLTEIYAAGEEPIADITIERVAESVRAAGRCPVHIVKSLQALPAAVAQIARSGDLVITLGAGSIGTVADRILDALRERPAAGDTRESDADLSTEARGKAKSTRGEGE